MNLNLYGIRSYFCILLYFGFVIFGVNFLRSSEGLFPSLFLIAGQVFIGICLLNSVYSRVWCLQKWLNQLFSPVFFFFRELNFFFFYKVLCLRLTKLNKQQCNVQQQTSAKLQFCLQKPGRSLFQYCRPHQYLFCW